MYALHFKECLLAYQPCIMQCKVNVHFERRISNNEWPWKWRGWLFRSRIGLADCKEMGLHCGDSLRDQLMLTNCQFMYLDLSISLHYININTEYTDNWRMPNKSRIFWRNTESWRSHLAVNNVRGRHRVLHCTQHKCVAVDSGYVGNSWLAPVVCC